MAMPNRGELTPRARSGPRYRSTRGSGRRYGGRVPSRSRWYQDHPVPGRATPWWPRHWTSSTGAARYSSRPSPPTRSTRSATCCAGTRGRRRCSSATRSGARRSSPNWAGAWVAGYGTRGCARMPRRWPRPRPGWTRSGPGSPRPWRSSGVRRRCPNGSRCCPPYVLTLRDSSSPVPTSSGPVGWWDGRAGGRGGACARRAGASAGVPPDRLRAALDAAVQAGRNRRRELLDGLDGAALVRAMPLWVGTVTDVEDLLPPIPGLFDLVILDEAAHIDQIRAAPVLARARRALVVGDPRQLRFVSFVADVDVALRSEERRVGK